METGCDSCEVQTGLYILLQVASISQLTVSRLSRQCGILNFSQRYRPPRSVIGIALFHFYIGLKLVLIPPSLASSTELNNADVNRAWLNAATLDINIPIFYQGYLWFPPLWFSGQSFWL
jgi:hypothetical protein